MKVIVCGGRDYMDQDAVFSSLDRVHGKKQILLLAHGGATGADALAGNWASSRCVEQHIFRANWDKHGKCAGPIRNLEMLVTVQPDGVIAFPGGKGTTNMIHVAEHNGYKVWRPVRMNGFHWV